MKLLSFLKDKQARYGVLYEGAIIDLTKHLGHRYSSIKDVLKHQAMDEIQQLLRRHPQPDYALSDVELLPVIPNPEKIFCVGQNYYDHVQEMGSKVTGVPVIFSRYAASQVAHGQAIVRPFESEQLDYEGEIAIIIGRSGRRIAEQEAWEYIAGYSCYNDGSVRDWQKATSQWIPGKNFYRTGGFGPWMVTSDEIVPDQVLTLVTRLNGQEMQRSDSSLMIHSIPKQIAHISSFIALEPGDVIVTGTPGGVGVGRQPPVFLKPGDKIEVEVEAIGVLSNTVVEG